MLVIMSAPASPAEERSEPCDMRRFSLAVASMERDPALSNPLPPMLWDRSPCRAARPASVTHSQTAEPCRYPQLQNPWWGNAVCAPRPDDKQHLEEQVQVGSACHGAC
jgi:hypothetical protein